jgi:hypothetical protein
LIDDGTPSKFLISINSSVIREDLLSKFRPTAPSITAKFWPSPLSSDSLDAQARIGKLTDWGGAAAHLHAARSHLFVLGVAWKELVDRVIAENSADCSSN